MKRTLFALFLITTLLTSFACERRGNATNGGGTGPIMVGYYGDLSGRTSSFGQSTKNGVEMAADEINKAGGINGRTIQIITEDDQGEPNKAATVVTKLINQDKVMALLGEVASSNSLAAAPKAQEAKIRQAGGKIVKPIFSFPGGRRFHFSDPSGNELAVWSEA